MNSRLFEESFIVRFLKQLFVYAQSSYLFHFDFKLAISKHEETEVKPLGFFESLLALFSDGLGHLSKGLATILQGSLLFRTKVTILKSLQEDAVGSVLYFMIGFLMLYGWKTMSVSVNMLFDGMGLFTLWVYPLVRKYGADSVIFKVVNTFLKGGDAK